MQGTIVLHRDGYRVLGWPQGPPGGITQQRGPEGRVSGQPGREADVPEVGGNLHRSRSEAVLLESGATSWLIEDRGQPYGTAERIGTRRWGPVRQLRF